MPLSFLLAGQNVLYGRCVAFEPLLYALGGKFTFLFLSVLLLVFPVGVARFRHVWFRTLLLP